MTLKDSILAGGLQEAGSPACACCYDERSGSKTILVGFRNIIHRWTSLAHDKITMRINESTCRNRILKCHHRKSQCRKGLVRHNVLRIILIISGPPSIHAHLHNIRFSCMSQRIDYIRLEQPCEHPRCKAKWAYWEDGLLYCKQGHRQEVEIDRDIV